MRFKQWLLGLGAVLTAGATVIAVSNTALGRAATPKKFSSSRPFSSDSARPMTSARPIHFMVVSGSYTSFLAEERGFCKGGKYGFFAQLNPYRSYGNGWNELIRQSYAFGDIQGWTFSTGTIAIPGDIQSLWRAHRLLLHGGP